MKNIKLFLIIASLILPLIAVAGLVPCGQTADNPCTFCHFFVLLKNVIDFSILPPGGIAFIAAVLLLTVGGAMFVFSAGNPGIAGKGRKIMTAVLWGLVIIYCAWLLVNTFLVSIGVANFSINGWKMSEWYTISCQVQ